MNSICLVSWKGGTGKTTLACNLAERAGAAGLNTTLCDFDPQFIALRHCQLRATTNPDAPPIKGVRGSLSIDGIATLHAAINAEGCDLLVCDLPGADSFTLDHALSNIDLLLLPVTTAPYDILVTANLVRHGINKGWNMVLLPNNLSSSKTRTLQKLEVLQQMGVEVAPVGLIRRVSYWDASEVGLGVCEYAPEVPLPLRCNNFGIGLQRGWNCLETIATSQKSRRPHLPEKKTRLNITELPELDTPELGQIPEQAIPSELEAIDLETLNAIAARNGAEVHKKRAAYGVVSATADVKGKTRLTAHIPDDLRRDVQMATTLTNKRLSQIVEEALRLWMNAQGLRGQGG